MAKSQKLLKEDFVSNLSGGSVSEINLVCTVAPVCTLSPLNDTEGEHWLIV